MMTDILRVEIVKEIFGLLGTILSGVMVFLLARANRTADYAVDAARTAKLDLDRNASTAIGILSTTNSRIDSLMENVKEGRIDIDYQLDKIRHVSEKTQELVNSTMVQQHKITAIAFRRIAEITKDVQDIAMANAADELLKKYVGDQEAIQDS